MNLGIYSIRLTHESVAHHVVYVTVSAKQMNGLQAFALYQVFYGGMLFGIEGAAVDDYALTGVVPHHISVFAEHIANVFLNLQHGR
jgi:hypothetical protein